VDPVPGFWAKNGHLGFMALIHFKKPWSYFIRKVYETDLLICFYNWHLGRLSLSPSSL
jgi:hypothetical protein